MLYCNELSNEANLLRQQLKQLYGIETAEAAKLTVRLKLTTEDISAQNKEKYKLNITSGQILIEATTPQGVFNGTQTLLAALKGLNTQKELANQTIIDYPDLPYRGLLLDVARNFTKVEDVKD